MATVCTPFWQAHVRTEEVDFCVDITTTYGIFIPTAPVQMDTSFTVARAVSGESTFLSDESSVAEGYKSVGGLYVEKSGGFGGLLGPIIESGSAVDGPLVSVSEGSFNFDLDVDSLAYTGKFDILFFAYEHDTTKYAGVDEATNKVVIECEVNDTTSSVSFKTWLTLYYLVNVLHKEEVTNFFEGTTTIEEVPYNFIFNTAEEASNLISYLESDPDSTVDLAGPVLLSLYPFHSDDISNASNYTVYAKAKAPTVNGTQSNCYDIHNGTSPDKPYCPMMQVFDPSASPQPDLYYNLRSDGFLGSLSGGTYRVEVTPLRYLTVPYTRGDTGIDDPASGKTFEGDLSTGDAAVLDTDASDVKVGLSQVYTEQGF